MRGEYKINTYNKSIHNTVIAMEMENELKKNEKMQYRQIY